MKSNFYYIVTLLDGWHNRKPIASFGIDSLVNEYPEKSDRRENGKRADQSLMPGVE